MVTGRLPSPSETTTAYRGPGRFSMEASRERSGDQAAHRTDVFSGESATTAPLSTSRSNAAR